jgi:hypothetical protein
MGHRIPAPETDFLDPRTGKISKLWYQYLHDIDGTVSQTVNNITYGPFSPTLGGASGYGSSDGETGEPGPRGRSGRDGRDGVTRIVYVYLPADENEPMTVYRKLA